MKPEVPKVRNDLEFIPVQQGGQTVIVVRDHLDLVSEGTALPPELFELMALLDGSHSFRDLQMFMMRKKGGLLVGQEEIQGILAHLDQTYLLESERFFQARDRIVAEFTSRTVRPCSHCGSTYPNDKDNLRHTLEQILDTADPALPKPEGPITALVAPHIDLSVGKRAYANAYRWLSKINASRVVILGVGHQMRDGLFCLTEKDFETPLGRISTDKKAMEVLRQAGGPIITKDDFPHKAEHSLEFQALFLQHLANDHNFTIVPILCGSFWQQLSPCTREHFIEKAGRFLEELHRILEDKQQQTILVAGVDLSHIGPKFGHDRPAAYLKAQADDHDQTLLDALILLDAESFWEEATKVQDRFNVCGFSALACLLEILPHSKGTLLHYEMWFEPPTQSAVSFCAVGFARS